MVYFGYLYRIEESAKWKKIQPEVAGSRHDKQGNRHSYVLVIADIPEKFSHYDTSGINPNRITYHLACGSGDYLYAESISWSG